MPTYIVSSDGIATHTGTKTMIQIVAGSTNGCTLRRWHTSGNSSTAAYTRWKIIRQTNAGTTGGAATEGTHYDIAPNNSADGTQAETFTINAGPASGAWSVEPTTATINGSNAKMDSWCVANNGGIFDSTGYARSDGGIFIPAGTRLGLVAVGDGTNTYTPSIVLVID